MLVDDIKSALTQAMHGKESERVSALRLLVASLHNEKIAKRHDLTDEEVVQVLKREMRKREEARDLYREAGREDKASAEEKEIAVITSFLPAELGEAELTVIIDRVISEAGERPHFGEVMKRVMAEVKGRGDGAVISKIIKEKLSP